MFTGWLFETSEDRVVIDIGHLIGELSNGVLAVSVQVIEHGRLIPKMMVLLL